MASRRKLTVAGRLTWRDANGTLRFASVVTRDVSETDAFVECQGPASIPKFRLVHFQVERSAQGRPDLPAALRRGKLLSAIYRVGPCESTHRHAEGVCDSPAERAVDREGHEGSARARELRKGLQATPAAGLREDFRRSRA